MFVKKDLRKIPQILSQSVSSVNDIDNKGKENDHKKHIIEDLKLARRPAEFKGSLNVICRPEYASALQNLISLSLYDCRLESLDGIGFFASLSTNGFPESNERDDTANGKNKDTAVSYPILRLLNVGCNPITHLPSELALLTSLVSLWLDDCEIEGPFPECLYKLSRLETLRIGNNKITELRVKDDGLKNWSNLRILCLDGNLLKEIPIEIGNLKKLEFLMLRNNHLEQLPEGVPGSNLPNLVLLHVSSNMLKHLPSSFIECTSLKKIYANKNNIEHIPENLASALTNLTNLNLSNNRISELPTNFIERFGEPESRDGECTKDSSCSVYLDQNPLLEDKITVPGATAPGVPYSTVEKPK